MRDNRLKSVSPMGTILILEIITLTPFHNNNPNAVPDIRSRFRHIN